MGATRSMNILMFAHRLEVGGTQINAIELADALQRLHRMSVILFATPGPLATLAERKGLRFVAAPDASIHPSLARAEALRSVVRMHAPDVVHAWDWWQCLDACWALRMGRKVPLVVTDMMMELTRLLPKHLPTTFGTPEIVRKARSTGRSRAELLLPPVDVEANRPGVVDGHAFRRQHGIEARAPLLVTVSRLSDWMKSESLIRTVQSIPGLGHHDVTLAIVGEGNARAPLEAMARRVNASLGRAAVVFTGALLDPRPAYQAADIVIGMGGSALKGMAFGKPVVVVGEGGFSEIFDESTADAFHDRGMYGRATPERGNEPLIAQLRFLLDNPVRRTSIGTFSRSFVLQQYALEEVSGKLADFYRRSLGSPVCGRSIAFDALRTATVYVRERRFLSRSRDRSPIDAVKDKHAYALRHQATTTCGSSDGPPP